MSESQIQAAIMDALTFHPKVAWIFVTTTGTVKGRGGHWMNLGRVGLPDLLGQMKGIYGGVSIGLEIKTPGKRPTKAQEAFLDLIRANGGIAGVCTSVEEALEIVG